MIKKLSIPTCALLSVLFAACKKDAGDSAPTRSEFITVYETSESKTVDSIQVPFDGAQDGKIHVLTNVNLQWKYMVDQLGGDATWFQIKSVEEEAPGHIVVTYDAASLLPLNSLDRREGRLSFSCPEQSLGKFLTIRQGYQHQFTDDFSGETDGTVVITGNQTYVTKEYPMLNSDYFDYISMNVWAETTNEYRSKNITLDITVSGGKFYETGLTTYRINVPIGTGPEVSNLKYLLVVGEGKRMSPKTHFTFSVANDDAVFVHIKNFSGYKVTEAELGELFDDEYFEDEEEPDWQ